MLSRMRIRTQAYPFDRIATPAWAVKELFENDFIDLFENVESKKLFTNSDKEMLVDVKYNIRAGYIDPESSRLSALKEATSRRIERLRKVLLHGDPILFIRHEESHTYADLGERVQDDKYVDKYAIPEREYLEQLSLHLKTTYPSLKFKILFFNSEGTFADQEHQIVGIHLPSADFRDLKVGKNMLDAMNKDADFINSHL